MVVKCHCLVSGNDKKVQSTPLLEYLAARKQDKRGRDERRRREHDKRKMRIERKTKELPIKVCLIFVKNCCVVLQPLRTCIVMIVFMFAGMFVFFNSTVTVKIFYTNKKNTTSIPSSCYCNCVLNHAIFKWYFRRSDLKIRFFSMFW